MKKMLLLVDPQIDFITGTLPVPGAAQAMDRLADMLKERGDQYAAKIVTCDWHPYDHSSFTDCGGQWPRHCVRHDAGAAIWGPLLAPLHGKGEAPEIMTKGKERDREEYSIFANAEAREKIEKIIFSEQIGDIDVCGIAGDVCVLSTLKDGLEILGGSGIRFNILHEFSPSLDGGKALNEFSSRLVSTQN